MTARSRNVLRFAIFIVVLEIIYVIAGNAFIRSDTLKNLVNAPNKTFIDYTDAWTVLPGLAHVRNFSLSDQDQNVQWELKIEEATVSINLLTLPFRRLNLTKVNAQGANFKLRLQKSVEEKKPGIPEIAGFERPIPPKSDKPPEDRFRFLINNITLKDLREIWIDDHRFEGVIDAHGAFYVWPAQEFEIREAHF
ncbi:MAG: hypothetical protein ABL958_03500, partial [Bdellovibrionia bacterium]